MFIDREVWRIVPHLPGVLASNMGRIQLPIKEAKMPNGGIRQYVTHPTLGTITCSKKGATHQYRNIYNRTFGNMKVHQLVCEAFHGKPKDGQVVIHKDENALNNRASNLRWGTQKENLNMPKFIAYCRSRTGDKSPVRKGKR